MAHRLDPLDHVADDEARVLDCRCEAVIRGSTAKGDEKSAGLQHPQRFGPYLGIGSDASHVRAEESAPLALMAQESAV